MVEDILRYEYNENTFTLQLKHLRHSCKIDDYLIYVNARDAAGDTLKNTSLSTEREKSSLQELVIANIKRAQESARVLEELFKLHNLQNSDKFKSIRYHLYDIERNLLVKFFSS